MKQSIAQKDGQRVCEFLQQGQKGRIEWTTTSAHTFLQRYWPADTGVGDRLPPQIRQWMILQRKRLGAKDTSPATLAPLVINRPSACLTVRYMPDGSSNVELSGLARWVGGRKAEVFGTSNPELRTSCRACRERRIFPRSGSCDNTTMKKLKRAPVRFLICVDNKGYAVSLEKRKIYLALPDIDALKHGQVRVIDESGEDYLYPKSLSCPLPSPNLFGKPFSKRHSTGRSFSET